MLLCSAFAASRMLLCSVHIFTIYESGNEAVFCEIHMHFGSFQLPRFIMTVTNWFICWCVVPVYVSHQRGLPHKFFQGGATSTFCWSNCQVADDVRSRNALPFLHDYTPKKMSHVTTTVTQKHFVGSHSQIYCSDFHKRLSADFQSRILNFTKALPWSGPAFSQLLPIGPRAERGPALRLPTYAQVHFLLKLRV